MTEKEGFLDSMDDVATAVGVDAPPDADATPEMTTAVDKPAADKTKTDPANSPERPKGYVPEAALHEARNETKSERQARERAEASLQKLLDRFHAENEKPEERPDEDAPPEDPNDYVGKINWLERQLTARIAAEKQGKAQTADQQKAAKEWDEAVYSANTQLTQAKAADPTIGEAYNALVTGYRRALWAVGWRGPALEEQANKLEAEHILAAHRSRTPIGEYILQRAKEDLGWEPKPAGKPAEQSNGDGQKRDPATGQFVSEQEKAKRIAESQERNKSLSDAPGVPVEKMTAKELAKLDEEEQWQYFRRFSRKGSREFDRQMGYK